MLFHHYHHHGNHHLPSGATGWPGTCFPIFFPGLPSWVSGSPPLHSYCLDLEISPSTAFKEILNSFPYFQIKIPIVFPLLCFWSWSWPEKLDWTGPRDIWTLFVIFGYLSFPAAYTNLSNFPQWSWNIPILPYSYHGTHPAKFRMLLGSCIKRVLGIKIAWTKFLQDHNSTPGYDRN